MRQARRFLPLTLCLTLAGCIGGLPDEDGGTGGTSGAAGSNAGAGGTTSGTGGTAGASTGGTGVSGAAGIGAAAGTGGAVGTGAGSGGVAGSLGGTAGFGAVSGTGGFAGAGGFAGSTGGAGNGGVSGGGAGGRGGAGNGGGGSGGKGGQAGMSGASGSGGSSGFNPCPATGACKILPLGDSITDGVPAPGGGGYRISLFSRALAAGKSITFVGGSMNGPTMVDGQPFPRAHEGHSGWTIAQIDGIVPTPALNVTPHIVLLHIGTNDMYQSPAGAPGRLGPVLDQIVATLPNALLVVAKIIPLSNSSAVTTFNNALPALVQERANTGKHIILVDQFTGFPTTELADGVHPNTAGYARMAGVWYTAISSYLH